MSINSCGRERVCVTSIIILIFEVWTCRILLLSEVQVYCQGSNIADAVSTSLHQARQLGVNPTVQTYLSKKNYLSVSTGGLTELRRHQSPRLLNITFNSQTFCTLGRFRKEIVLILICFTGHFLKIRAQSVETKLKRSCFLRFSLLAVNDSTIYLYEYYILLCLLW